METEETTKQNKQEQIEGIMKEIAELERQRKVLDALENIVEAGKVNKKINKLKKTLSTKKKQEKDQKIINDKKALDDTFSVERSKTNKEWQESREKLLKELKSEEEKLVARHKEDTVSVKEHVLASIPAKPKPDASLLRLKQTKAALIKQKDYDKAYEIERKIKVHEAEKALQWESHKNAKVQMELEKLEKLFKRSLTNFDKKRSLQLFEFDRNHKKELDFLSKRYKNTATDIILSQKTLKHRLTDPSKPSNLSFANLSSPKSLPHAPGSSEDRPAEDTSASINP